jgi:hypothetical protein
MPTTKFMSDRDEGENKKKKKKNHFSIISEAK